jgi:DNA polymerase III delta prime subunit
VNSRILLSPYLEYRSNQIEKILQKLSLTKNHPDVLYFEDDQKLGVEAAKKIREHLSLKPYSAKGRVVVMESAHNLTLDAQNALLKTLEEPPESAMLLLGAETDKTFLPTVLSRCEIVRIGESEKLKTYNSDLAGRRHVTPEVEDRIEKLIESSVEERFAFVEKLEERQEFLESLIGFYRQSLALQPGVGKLNIMKILLEAEEWARANGNVRAILEYLMLRLPSE